MVRLLKVSKFYGAVEKQAGLSIGYSNIRMVILLLMILIIAHWMACALFIVYSYAEESGETTWVEAHGSIDSESSRIDMYLVAYYWAIMTLTTIGYGDVTAQNTKGVKSVVPINPKEIRKLDLRGEICPYPMLKTNEELDSDKEINILEVLTDHSPALSTIPPQALKRGYEVEIDEIDNSEWKITLKKDG